jgi:16S rRNA processing protein RimM
MSEYVKIGKTQKAFGLNGGIRVLVEDRYVKEAQTVGVWFVLIDGRQVPYFVESIINKSPLAIKFEDIDRREDAYAVANKALYLRKQDLSEESLIEQQEEYTLFQGYLIVDEKKGTVGQIDEIVSLPQQIMAVIKKGEQEIFIPLNETFILSVDQQAKQIDVALPDGLLELF